MACSLTSTITHASSSCPILPTAVLGTLPDGRIYLFSNAMPNTIRDPLTLLLSSDGYDFNLAVAAMSCTLLHDSRSATVAESNECGPKYPGKAKNPGVSMIGITTVQ
jgi:hypothetical protein